MQSIQILFNELSKSIYMSQIDFELLSRLKQQLKKHNLISQAIEDYLRLIILIYELSNYEKLYQIKKDLITVNQMAIKLKGLVCFLMGNVIHHFDKSVQTAFLFPLNLLSQAVQIMIICSRICLNEGKQYSSEVHESYKFIHNAFEYVVDNLDDKTQFLHHLNTLEIMKYKLQTENFNILEFQKRLNTLFCYEEAQSQQYTQFIQNFITEVVLKSLKNGKASSENVRNFYIYLTQTNKQMFQSLLSNCQISMSSSQKGLTFLQIYNQIKIHGIESINIDYLKDFIKDQENFNDQRIFQIAAITQSPVIIEIWFSVLNSKKQKSNNLSKALQCFIHISQNLISKENTNEQILKNQKNLLKLSNNVLLVLLTQKKDNKTKTSEPILGTIKTLVKILNYFCFNLCDNMEFIKDFGQRLGLLCSRYNCLQICKVIYSVLLYYYLSKKQRCDQIFEKFNAHHNNEKSNQLYKILKLAYEFQTGKIMNFKGLDSYQSQLKKQPFIVILFSKAEQDMLIFEIDVNEFKQVDNKMLIYSELIKKYINSQKNISIIINHMENVLIKLKIDEFMKSSTQENNITNLKSLLYHLLKGQMQIQKSQVAFLLINLLILQRSDFFSHFCEYNFGILLNKYSKHVKMLSQVIEFHNRKKCLMSEEFYSVCCSYLIFNLQKFKKQYLKKQRIGQPGEIIFVHSVMDIVKLYIKDISQSNHPQKNRIKKIEINYINFVIFELDCLTNNSEKYLNEIQIMQIELLKSFNQSLFIPKYLKHKILRSIIKECLFSSENNVSIKQLKEIIEITDNQQEVGLYLKCLGTSYGEEGKKLLMLMANKDKRIQKILLQQQDDIQI